MERLANVNLSRLLLVGYVLNSLAPDSLPKQQQFTLWAQGGPFHKKFDRIALGCKPDQPFAEQLSDIRKGLIKVFFCPRIDEIAKRIKDTDIGSELFPKISWLDELDTELDNSIVYIKAPFKSEHYYGLFANIGETEEKLLQSQCLHISFRGMTDDPKYKGLGRLGLAFCDFYRCYFDLSEHEKRYFPFAQEPSLINTVSATQT